MKRKTNEIDHILLILSYDVYSYTQHVECAITTLADSWQSSPLPSANILSKSPSWFTRPWNFFISNDMFACKTSMASDHISRDYFKIIQYFTWQAMVMWYAPVCLATLTERDQLAGSSDIPLPPDKPINILVWSNQAHQIFSRIDVNNQCEKNHTSLTPRGAW